jgi:RNA polymerase sigma-70 factor (ECF subfamily)
VERAEGGGLGRRALASPAAENPAPALGDEEGVRAAYAAHGAELYRFALRQLGDPEAARDAVQETFLRAWRSADRYDPQLASLRVWLFAIARNTLADVARRAAARPWLRELTAPLDLEAAATAHAEPDPSDRVMRERVVEDALRRLSAPHRTAIVETYLRGRPYAEVAAEQGVPVATVRTRVFYALKALRLAMEEMGVQP